MDQHGESDEQHGDNRDVYQCNRKEDTLHAGNLLRMSHRSGVHALAFQCMMEEE